MAKPPLVIGQPPAAEKEVVAGDEMAMAGEEEMMAGEEEEEAASDNVLFTVSKEADGTYRLIMGDEDDEVTGEAMDDAVGGEPTEGAGKVFDSPGALLKAILDMLNEDGASEGEEGTSEEQFQEGFGEEAAAPAPVAQKY